MIILGSLHGERDALFGFYQECFNTFSTLILFFIYFGAERKHIIFIILLVQNTTDTHLNDHVPDLILALTQLLY